ncbi:hypothetical protein Vadar_018178 [Vaccinium darrowii]|uniref:Uncharacterized protein n=1 Tax=Vaccinium darrowii TaxID=229202 RepID=A0ACB7YPT1_9ERIC|nr:hypothetical protein Vadar_018178 [Vaccinium darrowii]
MPGPKGFILPHYQASSSSSQFNHPGEQRDVPVGGKLKMGAASHPGAVPGRWKEPNPLFNGASNIALSEKALPSPTAQNPVLLSKEQVIEYVQDQFGPALQSLGGLSTRSLIMRLDPNYQVAIAETEESSEVAVAEIVNRKPYACKAFVKVEPTKAQGSMASPKTTRAYTFDIMKAEEIFDQLMADKLLRFSVGHKIPSPAEIKGKEYCKYHNSWNHTTVNCIIFRNAIQDRIDKGDFKFPEAVKKGMAVDEDPFPADFGANMVYVDMRGAPRTVPRQKISLGAPSQAAKGKQILHDSDNSPDDHPSPVWWDQEVIRSRRGSSSTPKKPSVHHCYECGKPEKPKRLQSVVVKRPREETPSLSPRRFPQKRVSVFNRLKPITHEIQKQMSSLVITAPQEGRPRMVKPPGSVSPNHWFKMKHPKFPQPENPLSKSQKRRRQRIRQAERLAQGIPTPPPIPPKRYPAPKHGQEKPRMEYRPVQKPTPQHVEPSSAEIPKVRKPAWKDILAKPRPINIRSSEDMLVVQEEAPVTKVSSSLASLSCNMVFVLPTAFMAKEGQPSSMDGDVEVSGDAPEISSVAPVAPIPVLEASAPESSVTRIPSIVVLKDEPTVYRPSPVASVLFEKPDPMMTQHLRPLYIQGHLDGIPVNRILVDNGSAANLMPRFMLVKLGKGDQDLLPSSASISDFAGGITTAQGIIIMNLQVGTKTLTTPFFVVNSRSSYNLLLGRDWIHVCMAVPSTLHQCLIFWHGDDVEVVWADKRPFLASSNYADAKLYDNEISPVKFTGTDKYGKPTAITLSTQTSVDEFKAIYKQLAAWARLIAYITEESLRSLDEEDNSVLTTELFFEGDSTPPDDVIQLEDLEAPPAKLDDLKADVQDPLEEINLGSEDQPKPIYVSQRLPEVVKSAYVNLLHEYKDCFAWETASSSGCGILIISPAGVKTQLSFQFDFQCTNNQAEYEGIIIGLEILREMGAATVEVIGDSQLAINQLGGIYKCNSEEIAPYYMAARQLLDEFDDASLLHVPRRFNQEANELAQIATGIKIPQGWYKRTITIQKRSLPSVKRRSASMEVFTTDLGGQEEDWRTEIITFLKYPSLSSTKKIRKRAIRYVLIEDELYKKSLEDDLLLKCIGPQESLKILMDSRVGLKDWIVHQSLLLPRNGQRGWVCASSLLNYAGDLYPTERLSPSE